MSGESLLLRMRLDVLLDRPWCSGARCSSLGLLVERAPAVVDRLAGVALEAMRDGPGRAAALEHGGRRPAAVPAPASAGSTARKPRAGGRQRHGRDRDGAALRHTVNIYSLLFRRNGRAIWRASFAPAEHRLPRPVHLSPPHPPPLPPTCRRPGACFAIAGRCRAREPGAALAVEADLPLAETLRRHWPEYADRGRLPGRCSCWPRASSRPGCESPAGPAPRAARPLAVRRLLAGLAMGLALIAMIYSPWGRRSGTHLNPAITLAYLRLGKIGRWDAAVLHAGAGRRRRSSP